MPGQGPSVAGKAHHQIAMNLFEYAAAKADQGVARAAGGAGPETISRAVAAVLEVARELPSFTSDDVRARYGDFGMAEPRAWGAVMRQAAGTGAIVATDHYRKTGRTSSHNRPMRVWRARLTVDI